MTFATLAELKSWFRGLSPAEKATHGQAFNAEKARLTVGREPPPRASMSFEAAWTHRDPLDFHARDRLVEGWLRGNPDRVRYWHVRESGGTCEFYAEVFTDSGDPGTSYDLIDSGGRLVRRYGRR